MATFSSLYASPRLSAFLPEAQYVRGFTFAVATAPEIPMPETWMPWVVTGSSTVTLTTQELDTLAEGLMDALRENLRAMRDQKALLPEDCKWREGANQQDALETWLTGLLAAHKQLEPNWQQAWTLASKHWQSTEQAEAPSKRLTRCLKLFTTLAKPEMALEVRTEEQAEQLRKHLPALYRQLPAMLKDYVNLAGELAKVLPNQFETFQQTPN